MKNIIQALVQARSEFPNLVKNRVNPHFKSKFADLDAVIDCVNPSLLKHGIYIFQAVQQVGESSCLVTHLYHESGECLQSSYPLPTITDPQKLGSAVTYARRYSLCAALNIAADDDDDGNAAKKASTAKPSAKSGLPFSNPQEGIQWAAETLKITEEEAAQMLAETPKDPATGKKSDNFHKKVLQMAA